MQDADRIAHLFYFSPGDDSNLGLGGKFRREKKGASTNRSNDIHRHFSASKS
jgi:hypothetical protein